MLGRKTPGHGGVFMIPMRSMPFFYSRKGLYYEVNDSFSIFSLDSHPQGNHTKVRGGCRGGVLMKHVLLIEDDLDYLAVLAVALAESGYRVIPKVDCESALAILREDVRMDLIIIDYQMPGLDGLSFMSLLREFKPSMPVIILSKQVSVNDYIKFISLGAFEYLNKPVRVCELTRIAKVALERPLGYDDVSMHEP
jgi:CheY-like chemotaxis protein